MQKAPKTLFEKIWERHVVVPETKDTPAILYIDLHLIHEVTTPQAFTLLREKDLKVRSPDKVLATMDHSTPTVPISSLKDLEIFSEQGPAQQIRDMVQNCKEFGLELCGVESERRGIVDVIGPELGATQPGKTIVCGDSHTATHGAFCALAFGIGTSEVEHVLATQTLIQKRPKNMKILVEGTAGLGVTVKDVILSIIGIAAILYFFRQQQYNSLPMRVALGFIGGGAIGNLIDRLKDVVVVDYISVGWWPAFTVADSFISVGRVIVLPLIHI